MKNKTFSIIEIIFSVFGVCLLIVGFFSYKLNKQFIQSNSKSAAVVIDLNIKNDVFYPVLSLKTIEGKTIKFISSVGSNPSLYQIGDVVEVYYDPTNLQSIRINDFWSNWLTTLILSSIGIIFSIFGLLGIGFTIKSNYKKRWLYQFGKKISTEFEKVEINKNFSINDEHPYIIISQWQDPITKVIHIFKSENIWYNPEKYIVSKSIDVLVDPNNYKKYYTDISFLPK